MLEAFRILEEDKGIKKEDIIEAVTESLRSAYRRRYGQADSAAIEFNEKTGDFRVYTVREVVDEVFDSRLEISLKDALAISSAYELGDKIKFEEAPAEFGRVAAQSAKQTIMEKMRKQTRAITYNKYKEHENEIMSGTVERFDNRFIYVNLGSIEAQLSKQDQIPGEVFASHDRIEVFVYKVEDNPRGVNVFVSRSHPEMIKRLMEQEIPEVYDGTVEIMSVSREAGDRTKVAVRSHNPNVDAIGTIVGRGGANIKKITSKFHPAKYDAKSYRMIPIEENIDVIEWVADPAEFIYNAILIASIITLITFISISFITILLFLRTIVSLFISSFCLFFRSCLSFSLKITTFWFCRRRLRFHFRLLRWSYCLRLCFLLSLGRFFHCRWS